MRREKILNTAYLVVQLAIFVIYTMQASMMIQYLAKLGPLILVDFILGFSECLIGFLAMLTHMRTERPRMLTVANYIPLLILIEGGILAFMGGILIALATASNFFFLRRDKTETN